MAGVRDSDTRPVGPWPGGIDNTSHEARVDPRAVRGSVNFDFDNDGIAQRRQGTTQVEALPGLHTVWAHPLYPFLLGADDTALYAWDEQEERATLAALTGPRMPLSCDYAAGSVFFSNTVDAGRIYPDGSVRAWATQKPLGPPTLALATDVGGLDAGVYQITQTFIDDTGRESGAPECAEITVGSGQGILLQPIPQPTDAAVEYVRIYASRANGKSLEHVTDLPVGVTTFLLGVGARGRACETHLLDTMPPGQIVRLGNLRQFVARGNTLRWSPAGHYGLTKLSTNYTRFDDTIRLLQVAGQATNAGWYIATRKRTWYMAGPDPAQWPKAIAYGHGAVPGTAAVADAQDLGVQASGPIPYWIATNGRMVAGLPSGQVVPLSTRYVGPVDAEGGAATLRSTGGVNHIIAMLRNQRTGSSGLAAGDSVSAEVVRNGIVVG